MAPIPPLPTRSLRWTCPDDALQFTTTEEVEPVAGIVGQSCALDALSFGLECRAKGQNIFVRGLSGSGRLNMVHRLLKELNPPCGVGHDLAYVHNFSHPERPRLLRLAVGEGAILKKQLRRFLEFLTKDMQEALNSEPLRARRQATQERTQEQINALTKPFDDELRKSGLALVSLQNGPVTQTAIFPLVDDQPIAPEQLGPLQAEGKISAEAAESLLAKRQEYLEPLAALTREVSSVYKEGASQLEAMVELHTREILTDALSESRSRFDQQEVQTYLSEIIEEIVETQRDSEASLDAGRFAVNLLFKNKEHSKVPMVVENNPTLSNLLGSIDPEWSPQGPLPVDHRRISAGSILQADGGYLILDAQDLLTEPGSWSVLLRTLRTGQLEILPQEIRGMFSRQALKPEAIDVDVRVILIGSAGIYYQLNMSEDFCDLFKVLADFDSTIEFHNGGVEQYAGVLSRIAREEKLPPFHRSAVAKLAEHGARIAERHDRLTTRFSRIADIAREAAFLATKNEARQVEGSDVKRAIRRTKERAQLPSVRFQQLLADGTIKVFTQGSVVGQINGLAVISAGPLKYGFPARITSTISAGSAGLINIESRASLSGSIHTKGFHILGGLLRHLLRADHPLAFSASVAFEQSYGGIDGDSASGAEACCLLSALTGIPIRQSIAMTGAIDQHGAIQAIGGANEKIEGFFDTCKNRGLTGDQGVIIPQSNAGDLMLREDVVEACSQQLFSIWAVGTVHEALEILTGIPAGVRSEAGVYPEGSLLQTAVKRAEEFWRRTLQSPAASSPTEI